MTVKVPTMLQELKGIDLLAEAQGFGLNLLGALLILLGGLWVAKRCSNALDRAFTRAAMEATLRVFLRNIFHAAMVVVIVVAALQFMGAPMTSVLAVLGAAGLAIGLALKDSLSNMASGVMLIMQRPFQVGDFIQAAGMEGTVDQIRVFQTRMHTIDNRTVVLPNSLITAAPIINFTANPKRRIDLVVAVGYDDDLKLARERLLAVAALQRNALQQPAPEVLVTALAESGVNLELRVWVKTADLMRVKSELTEAVRNEVIGSGFKIANPPRDLHVYHHDADGRPLMELLARSGGQDGGDAGDHPPHKTKPA